MLTPEEEAIARRARELGKTREEALAGIEKYRASKQVDQPKEKGFLQRVSSDIQNRGANVVSELQNTQQNPLLSGINATAQAFGGVTDVANEAIRSVPGGNAVLNTAEDVVGGGFKLLTDKIASTKLFSDIGKLEAQGFINQKDNPEFYALKDALQASGSLGEIAGTIAGAKATADSLSGVKSGVVNVAKKSNEVATKAFEGTANAVASPIKPENIMQRVARIPKGAQAKFEATSGESVGKYLTKRGIYGNTDDIATQLYKRFTDSKGVADESLAKLQGRFQPVQVKDALDMLEEKFTKSSSKGVKDPNLSKVTKLIKKYEQTGLDMSEINEAKRLFEGNVKLDFLRENSPDGIRLANNVDESIRKWQFAKAEELGLKNLPDINKETRLAKQLLDAIGKESAGSAGNNALTLTDYILLAGGDPTAISAFVGKKVLSSKGVQSAIAKKLYKGETVGSPKAQFGDAKPLPLALPKPSGKTPIKLPDPRQYNPDGSLKTTSAKVVSATKNLTTINPKTKRFQTSYSSTPSSELFTKPSIIKRVTKSLKETRGSVSAGESMSQRVKRLNESSKKINTLTSKGIARMEQFLDWADERIDVPKAELPALKADAQKIADYLGLEGLGTDKALFKEFKEVIKRYKSSRGD